MPENDPPQLDYAPPSRWHRGRTARRIAALGLAIVAVVLGLRWGNVLVHRVEAHYWFDRCMSYTAESNQVAYRGPRDEGWAAHAPRPWLRFFADWSGSGTPRSLGTLFLHARTTPSGERRLVAVDLVSVRAKGDLQVQSRVFAPPVGIAPARLMSTGATTLPLPADPGELQIFAGQIDAKNAAHFELTFAIGDRRGLIDGWLKNDDTIVLELRNPLIDSTQPASAR